MPFDDQIAELLADYQRERENVMDLQQKLASVSCSAAAPRNTVKVTVGAQGDISGLEFPTKAYRKMTPKELADAILKAVSDARNKAKIEVAELMAVQLPGANITAWMEGTPDLQGILPEEPQISDGLREYLNREPPNNVG
ncbi:YbaB/EbfC family nucleoid-associated protein [Streptomyces sp. NBC_00151]|jgi:DNA-binding protein YbaB|uniref:YbaB/EbfC family nucleoid-associated protein n=1 Tax=Streptomyces sp. NBC_00151 TaxID=2975669 RepID=UPI002DDA3670|nr:YbaB/EbfC family nucleoid-associated protein [Streptomyces sp. NBC_00151]WRZ36738.1 YbaB/EbfC family nucleoid-associated protein [Streptomyces sp. NBC_00151]WRZ44839.1 YbaB/EbfC family nucleoid-associated protein [Streptomyces sp. NBC_00151]